MDTGNQNLRKQLAVAVKSIQWSYSIFWSISSTKPGVLEWGEGYYNGDIKTRKTVEAVEWDVDQMSLKRSEQLRELYESFLVADETNPQSRIPSAALMPEDLSHTEWYYLVCMSFVFNLGQGLPGRAFGNGKPMWLCNAHQTDSRVFSRSVLAKSASIQTIVCFPFLDGVVEMGTTDLVLEDHSLIQYVEASLPQIPFSLVPNDFDNALTPIARGEEFPLDCNQPEFMTEGVDDEDPISVSKIENERKIHPQEQEDNCLMKMEPCTHDQSIDDLHYHNVLGSIFKTKHELIQEPSFRHGNKESGFVSWNKGGGLGSYHNGSAQRILKKILFRAPHAEHKVGGVRKDIQWNPEADNLATSHLLAERKRVNDRFCALKSLIPSIYKDDKVSILDDTIKYMKELERRVKELEVCQVGLDECCDNYRNNKVGVKRKAGDVDFEGKMEDNLVSLRDSSTSTNLSISLIQKDVSIEMTCPHKQCLLLQIIDALSGLRLDAHSVQSSVFDGFLSVTIKAKIKGFGGLSARMIREVLQALILDECCKL